MESHLGYKVSQKTQDAIVSKVAHFRVVQASEEGKEQKSYHCNRKEKPHQSHVCHAADAWGDTCRLFISSSTLFTASSTLLGG